jgi:hypothetical protein
MQPISYSKDLGQDMIRSMKGFSFATALDLKMVYYYIKIDVDAQKLCTIHYHDTWENTNTNPWVSRLPGSRCFS